MINRPATKVAPQRYFCVGNAGKKKKVYIASSVMPFSVHGLCFYRALMRFNGAIDTEVMLYTVSSVPDKFIIEYI